jgi:type II secretory pathway pseudopilin PulG
MKRMKSQTGMSLVEATIILMVLMLLTGVLAPSINDFVNDAKDVKVKEDCEAIGVTVMRLARDVGPCFKFNASQQCDRNNQVELLFSNGADFNNQDLDNTAQSFSSNNLDGGQLNWDLYNQNSIGDLMQDQFTENAPAYKTPGDVLNHNPLEGFRVPGPSFYLGWRGAYLPSSIGPDPWGRKYLVNAAFLASPTDGGSQNQEGGRVQGWRRDVICLSGGRDIRYSTHVAGGSTSAGSGMRREGDDFVYVISGDTR